ncbi:hypothetical protein B0H14DRAFT_2581782 [Mycena olivaceomarginata]|nr:hypothetical protein B0H14DRAFT_2581782 [Mycena olivaceomarginata]
MRKCDAITTRIAMASWNLEISMKEFEKFGDLGHVTSDELPPSESKDEAPPSRDELAHPTHNLANGVYGVCFGLSGSMKQTSDFTDVVYSRMMNDPKCGQTLFGHLRAFTAPGMDGWETLIRGEKFRQPLAMAPPSYLLHHFSTILTPKLTSSSRKQLMAMKEQKRKELEMEFCPGRELPNEITQTAEDLEGTIDAKYLPLAR